MKLWEVSVNSARRYFEDNSTYKKEINEIKNGNPISGYCPQVLVKKDMECISNCEVCYNMKSEEAWK